jgi:hypothetical protein
MRMAEFGFFSFSLLLGLPPLLPALLGLPPFTGGLRPPMLKTGTSRCRLAFEDLCGTYRKAVQQHSRNSCTSQPGREEAPKIFRSQ